MIGSGTHRAWPAVRLFPEETKNTGQETENGVLEYALGWSRRLGRLGMSVVVVSANHGPCQLYVAAGVLYKYLCKSTDMEIQTTTE